MDQFNALIENFMSFWLHFFPETGTMERQAFLARIGDATKGSGCVLPDAQMTGYQDKVALSYGIYEVMDFQIQTLVRILTNIQVFPESGHMVSLGCGPASYELWLLTMTKLSSITLVDHSPEMLARARQIAEELGESHRVKTIVTDATASGIPNGVADIVLSVNAMHWSQNWRRWIEEIIRIGKPGAELFLTLSLGHPRSKIMPDPLLRACSFNVINANFVMPPQQLDGQVAQSSRYFVYGTNQ